ncbi:MAG: MBL fold metallo-hydrolase [Nitrospirota bacterium]
MPIKFINNHTASLKDENGRHAATLLWGDPVHIQESTGDLVKVIARNRIGWIKATEISDKSLLEIYVIDVGQGDGVLMKTPDGNWHLIDAGVASRDQMTRKSSANFLRWKFHNDLRQQKIILKNIIVTHHDYDHYGGLIDLLSGRLYDGTILSVEVENFFHSGIGRFKSKPKLGATIKGEVSPFPNGDKGIRRKGTFISELFDGKESFRNPSRKLEERFAEYAALVGHVPKNVRLISHRDNYLPGYAHGESDVSIKVLGPVLEKFMEGSFGLRILENESVTLNGHSIVLRIDYGNVRILLTGDLNELSQKLLLSYHATGEFEADVVKGCHHGSEDIDMSFIKAINAKATIISSGDNEDYSHPRPLVLGASARYGREAKGIEGKLMPPLIYSTELARSVKLGYAESVRVRLKDAEGITEKILKPEDADVKTPKSWYGYRHLENLPISTDLVYGLINVRTDGENILCATMEEKGNDFDVKVFKAGTDV